MSREELKEEINKVLNSFSENALQEILHFLKGLDKQPFLNKANLEKILKEDKNLLRKLAQ